MNRYRVYVEANEMGLSIYAASFEVCEDGMIYFYAKSIVPGGDGRGLMVAAASTDVVTRITEDDKPVWNREAWDAEVEQRELA